MRNPKVLKLVQCALIAALYTALTLAVAPLSYGNVQIRFSEALTLLAVFSPTAIVGLTLGCAVSNTVGFFMGLNILGAFDIIFGSLATLIAAVMTYLLKDIRFKGLPILAALPPIFINGLIIGAELAIMFTGSLAPKPFAINGALVALGQVIPCLVLGVLLVYTLEKTGADKKLFPKREVI